MTRRRRAEPARDRPSAASSSAVKAGSMARAALPAASSAGKRDVKRRHSRRLQRQGRREPRRDRAELPRPSDSRPSARAMSGAPRSCVAERDRQSRGWRAATTRHPGARAIAARSVERRGEPVPRAAARPAAVTVRCNRRQQRVRRAAVAGAENFQAGAGRRVQRQQPGRALRHRARQARQRAGLRCSHIVQRHGGGDRLGIGEGAERIEAGGAERLADLTARGERIRHDRPRRPPWRPFAERHRVGGQDLGRIEPAEQRRQLRRRDGGRLEQPGRDVEPRGANRRSGIGRARAADWAAGGPAACPPSGCRASPAAPPRAAIGALPARRAFGSSICSATATRKPRRIRRAR